jgi:hypothetical protein
MNLITLILVGFFSVSVLAAQVDCTAKVANRTYKVSLDSATRLLDVEVDTGTKYTATSNFFHSLAKNADIWSIPTSYSAIGLEFVWDISGQKHWICLKATECYVCK